MDSACLDKLVDKQCIAGHIWWLLRHKVRCPESLVATSLAALMSAIKGGTRNSRAVKAVAEWEAPILLQDFISSQNVCPGFEKERIRIYTWNWENGAPNDIEGGQ